MVKKIIQFLRDPAQQGLGTLIGFLSLIVAILSASFIAPLYAHPSATVVSTPQATAVSSPVSSANVTATPIPPPTPTATVAQAPTPTETLPPIPTVPPTPTATPCQSASTSNVDAVVANGCSYSIAWIFGFKSGYQFGEGIPVSVFMGGGNLGEVSDIGLSPYTHYSGQPLWAWLYQLNQGGYAIVVANSSGQPTQQQLGYAVNTGPVQGMGGGAYLPTNYTLQSTIPKSGGYQFNLAAV